MPSKLKNSYIDEKLKYREIKRIGDYDILPAGSKIDFICDKGHIFQNEPKYVVNRGWGCTICNKSIKWTNELINIRIKEKQYPLKCTGVVVNGHIKTSWQCLLNPEHTWENIPTEVMIHGKCPHCAERSKKSIDVIKKLIAKNNNDIMLLNNTRPKKGEFYTFKCKICTLIWDIKTASDIYSGRCGCPSCAGVYKLNDGEIDKRLISIKAPVKRLGTYKNISSVIKWKCLICENEYKKNPRSVIWGQGYCPKCFPGNLKN